MDHERDFPSILDVKGILKIIMIIKKWNFGKFCDFAIFWSVLRLRSIFLEFLGFLTNVLKWFIMFGFGFSWGRFFGVDFGRVWSGISMGFGIFWSLDCYQRTRAGKLHIRNLMV